MKLFIIIALIAFAGCLGLNNNYYEDYPFEEKQDYYKHYPSEEKQEYKENNYKQNYTEIIYEDYSLDNYSLANPESNSSNKEVDKVYVCIIKSNNSVIKMEYYNRDFIIQISSHNDYGDLKYALLMSYIEENDKNIVYEKHEYYKINQFERCNKTKITLPKTNNPEENFNKMLNDFYKNDSLEDISKECYYLDPLDLSRFKRLC